MEIRLVPDFYKEVKEESKSMEKYIPPQPKIVPPFKKGHPISINKKSFLKK